jgi:hypothetical protein
VFSGSFFFVVQGSADLFATVRTEPVEVIYPKNRSWNSEKPLILRPFDKLTDQDERRC